MGHAYKREAETARGLTLDEARRIASNIAKKPLRCILLLQQRRLRAPPPDLRTCCSARSLDLLLSLPVRLAHMREAASLEVCLSQSTAPTGK